MAVAPFDLFERLWPLYFDNRIEIHLIAPSLGVVRGAATRRRPRCARRHDLGWSLLQIVERSGARTRRDQCRPLLGAERYRRRQEGLFAALLHLRDDGL